jgi:RND family efflux transporter MFP subunit
MKYWQYWTAGLVVLVSLVICVVLYMTHTTPVTPVHAQEPGPEQPEPSTSPAPRVVDVIHPRHGMDLEIEQPGSLRAYETVQVQAKVSGFLKTEDLDKVDAGKRVKKGQVLAVIDVPELEKQMAHNLATLGRRKAGVKQMEARVVSARADRDAADAAVEQADASFKSAQAWVRYRLKVYQRMQELFATGSVEEKLVDEAREKYEASLETERAAKAAIATSKANLAASVARIDQADADVAGAKAEIDVAQADVDKTQVLIDYATITAPFDGIITRRNFVCKDYIRSPSEGAQEPLFTVQRTDKFRVVVDVPDSAVPFLDEGDPAIVRVDSLPGKKFAGVVCRKADSEDQSTRLMHTEIFLPNTTGELRDGMYGKVKILLDQFADKLSVPLSAVTSAAGHSVVYVVGDDSLAHRTEVQLGKSNGKSVVVLKGLRTDDRVVLHPSGVSDGTEVEAHLIQPAAPPPEQ